MRCKNTIEYLRSTEMYFYGYLQTDVLLNWCDAKKRENFLNEKNIKTKTKLKQKLYNYL